MRFDVFSLIRRIFMLCKRMNCDTCIHYDGRYGDDSCFNCEHSIMAVEYERRRT